MHHADTGNALALQNSNEDPEELEYLVRRYVDGIVSAFTVEALRARHHWGGPSPKPVPIVGLPRSGTTLVEQLLAKTADTCPGGEIRYWEDSSAAYPDGILAMLGDREAAMKTAEGYLRFLERVCPASPRVSDKFNDNIFHLGMIHLLFPKARIVLTSRNPLDVCVSIYLTPFRMKPAAFRTRAGILRYVRHHQRLTAHWKTVLPRSCYHEIEYEAVVADTEEQQKALYDFCGLALQADAKHHRVIATPSTWQARQKIYKTSVERWRNYEPWLGEFRALLD
jgi:hypothetical protein